MFRFVSFRFTCVSRPLLFREGPLNAVVIICHHMYIHTLMYTVPSVHDRVRTGDVQCRWSLLNNQGFISHLPAEKPWHGYMVV